MPIKVACKCGQQFAAPDKLAGKAVKCPKCGQPIRIPSPQAKQPKPQQPTVRPSQPQSGGLGNLLDEIGLAPQPTTGPKCPSCGAAVTPEAIICVECGFNSQTGERMQTFAEGGQAAVSHMSVAEKMLAKAEKEIQESPALRQGSHDFGDEGLKAYMVTCGMVAAIVLAMVVGAGFLYYVNTVIFAEGTSVVAIGSFFTMIVGVLLMMFAWVQTVGVSFDEHSAHGILSLVTYFYSVIYMIMRSLKLSSAIIVFLVGRNLFALGLLIYYEYDTASRPSMLRLILFMLAIACWDTWIYSLTRITGVAFDEKQYAHGIPCLLSTLFAVFFGPGMLFLIVIYANLFKFIVTPGLALVIYPYVYGFMMHKRCLWWTVAALSAAIVFAVFQIVFSFNLEAITTAT